MADNEAPIIQGLWNEHVRADTYGSKEQYHAHIFEQYKSMVQSADQISARRNVANTFFLTLHTFLIGTVGFISEKGTEVSNVWLSLLPLVAVLALCFAWWRILKSFRQLNTAKFKVIGEYERSLPTSPYWSAEWKALGEGKDPDLYVPLSNVEHWVPIIFALLYLIGFVALIFTG